MAACDFCDKHANEIDGLVFSRLGHKVCRDCLLVCEEILGGERAPKPIRADHEVDAPSDVARFLETLPDRSDRSVDWCLRRILRAAGPRDSPLALHCGFCGGRGRFVAGPRVVICSACVTACRQLLSGDHAGLFRLDVPQPAVDIGLAPIEPERWDQFSFSQLMLLAEGLCKERDRRDCAAVVTMTTTASTAPGVIREPDAGDGGLTTEASLSPVNRMKLECFAPGLLNINLIGGTGGLRESLARRIHGLSRYGRQFVRIDCRVCEPVVELAGAEEGTLFLDHVDALTPDGMERLEMAARVDGERALNRRLVTGASAITRLRGVALDLDDND